MKRTIALVFAVVPLLCGLFGCAGGPPDDGGRPVTITLSYYDGGYGHDWLTAVTQDFMENVNTEVTIELRKSSDNETAKNNIISDIGIADIYQIEAGMFGQQNVLEDLSSVYEDTVWGESVTVASKLSDEVLNYYNEGGSYYQIPQTLMTGWNWVYNKTLLDETFGEGGYDLPDTTDEFLAFGQELYGKGVFLTAGALADTQGGEYLRYAFNTWFAQMLGAEKYERYFNGYTTDAGGWVFCRENPQMIADNRTSLESVYALAETLLSRATTGVQYLHNESASMEYLDVDRVFYGGTFRRQEVAPFAFCYVGAWLESEIRPFLEEGTVTEQEVIAIKTPVISSIIERLDTVPDDATLSAVIDFVDGRAASAPAGVSEADVAAVREARNMVPENICRSFVIPKNAEHKEECKQFLTYLFSERAQKLSAQNAGGISILPYGYTPTDEDMGFEISPYIKSVTAISQTAEIVDVGFYNSPLTTVANLRWYWDVQTTNSSIAKDIFSGAYTPLSGIYESTYQYYANNWSHHIARYDELTQ